MGRELGEMEGDVMIAFGAFLRKNRKFDNLKQLKRQIEADITEAEIYSRL